MPRSTSRFERLDHWIRRSPPLLIAALVLFILVTGTTLARFADTAVRWYDHHYRWRVAEYGRIARLQSDFTLASFEEILGAPIFTKDSQDRRWTQYIFRGRDFWVQALTRYESPTVGLFSVTSCDPSFQPTFKSLVGATVVLHKTRLGYFRSQAVTLSYAIYADRQPWLYLDAGGSRVVNFESVAWGVDGACTGAANMPQHDYNYLSDLLARHPLPVEVNASRLPLDLGRRLIVNTFAEWGPTEFSWPVADFQIGIDEISLDALSPPRSG